MAEHGAAAGEAWSMHTIVPVSQSLMVIVLLQVLPSGDEVAHMMPMQEIVDEWFLVPSSFISICFPKEAAGPQDTSRHVTKAVQLVI